MRLQVRSVIIFNLFMLQLVSGCDDNKGGASAGDTTSGGDTTGNSMTDGSPTDGSPTEGGATGGSTGNDGTTGDGTTGGSTGNDGTTGDSGDVSLCQGACDKLLACEIEENVRECLSWCDDLEQIAAKADPRIFPECAPVVEEFLECVAQEPMCFETDPCSDLDFAIEEQCGCERIANGAIDGSECTYHEKCGVVSHDVKCSGGTCTCQVNGEDVGSCQAQAMICGDLMNLDPVAAAAGECCGWEPLESE